MRMGVRYDHAAKIGLSLSNNMTMAALKNILSKKNYISVPLELTVTDHLEIKAEINGVSGRFILDTGASNSCVALDKASVFNLQSEVSEVKAAGAGATNMETFQSSKNSLKIGLWKKKKAKVILFNLDHINEALVTHNALPVDGIIGADIMKKGKAIIDYKSKTLFLKKKKK